MAKVESKTVQKALHMILPAIGMRESSYQGKVTIRGKDPILASRHRLSMKPVVEVERIGESDPIPRKRKAG